MHIDIIIVTAYLALLIWMGLRGGGADSAAAFTASGKTFGAPIIFMSLAASYIGGGFSAGNAAAAFSDGIGMTTALLGFSAVTVWTGKYVVPRIARFSGASTVGDIICRTNGKCAGVAIGAVAFFTCAAVVGAQVQAMGGALHALLGIPPAAGILIGCGVMLVYSTVGGLQSVIAADIVQFILLAIGVPVLLGAALHTAGGMTAVWQATPSAFWNPLSDRTLPAFLSLMLTIAFGEMLVPPYTSRLLIGKNLRATAKGTMAGGWFSVVFFVMTGLIGLIARALQVTTVPADAMPSLVLAILPVGVRGLIMAAMVSILLSAADGFLNGAAVSMVHDVLVPLYPRLSDKAQLRLLRATNLLTGIAAVITALLLPNIFGILEISYSLWCPLAVVPLLCALFGINSTSRVFWLGLITGGGVTLLWDFALLRPLDMAGAPIGMAVHFAVRYLLKFRTIREI